MKCFRNGRRPARLVCVHERVPACGPWADEASAPTWVVPRSTPSHTPQFATYQSCWQADYQEFVLPLLRIHKILPSIHFVSRPATLVMVVTDF